MRHLLSRAGIPLLVVAAVLMPHALLAQETPILVRIDVDPSKDEGVLLQDVDIRPNTPMKLGFELRNVSKDITLGNVTVKLVQIVDGAARPIGEATLAKLAPTPVAAKGEMITAFKGVEKLDLAGSPPYRLQLQVEAKQPKDFVTALRDLQLVVLEPRKYVSAVARYDDKDKRRINFSIASPDARLLRGPHMIPVELSLSAGLKQDAPGTFKDKLTGPSQEVKLALEEVAFDPKVTAAEAYLKVDDFDRAFSFPIVSGASSGDISPRSTDDVHVRIIVDRFAKPNPKLPVVVQLDGPLNEDYRVKVELNQSGDKTLYRIELDDAGLRKQAATAGVAKTGELYVVSRVTDWRLECDTTGAKRDIWLRVSVARKSAKTKQYETVALKYRAETSAVLAPIVADAGAPGFAFVKVAQFEVLPDVKFVGLPKSKEWAVGTPMEVVAKISKPLPSIAKVELVLGKKPESDKEKVVVLDSVDVRNPEKDTEWKFKLPSQSKEEPVTISVRITTQTGATIWDTETIAFKAAVALGGRITGRVQYGSVPQPGLPVTLVDAKGNKLDATETDKKGEFLFENVKAGTYTFFSTRSFNNLFGQKMVTVRANDTKAADVTISLLSK